MKSFFIFWSFSCSSDIQVFSWGSAMMLTYMFLLLITLAQGWVRIYRLGSGFILEPCGSQVMPD